ncbi:MAG TPA: LPS export ABC transporter permease LptG [Gammaproteobacteria bacterium]|nr:LPS export ABC transporter permease LptG [Gammaproteobacteria bacterium]
MIILGNYIVRSVSLAGMATLFVILGLDLFLSMVDEMGDVGKGEYSSWLAIQYVLSSVPRRIYEMFPMIALIGTTLGLGILGSSQELIVMQAAGASIMQIFRTVMRFGILVLAAVVALGEFVAPVAEQYGNRVRTAAISGDSLMRAERGYWARDGQRFIHIDKVFPGGLFSGITIYEFDKEWKLQSTLFADRAHYRQRTWTLNDIVRSEFLSEQITTARLQEASWDSTLNPGVINSVMIDPDKLSTRELYDTIDFLQKNELEAGRYQLAFWNKVVQPVSSMVMIFLAIPFVFGPMRSIGMGQRVVTGALVGFGFYIVNKVSGQMSLVYAYPTWLGATIPSVLFLAAGMWMMARIR